MDGESIMSEFSEFGFMEAVAAIVIQTAVRRMLAMVLMEKMRQETYPPDEEQFETMAVHMQELAAIDIQAAFRGWRARDSMIVDQEAIAMNRQELAAIKIEAAFRGWWVRDSLNVDNFCARRIQRAYRFFRARLSFVFDLHRIVIVQSLWRRKMAEDKARQILLASRPQSVTPSRQSPKVRNFLQQKVVIENAAAVAIQSRWRGYDAQMIYLFTLSSIIAIQTIVRRWLTKPWLDRYLTSIKPPARRSLKILDEVCTRTKKHSLHRAPADEAVGTLGEANLLRRAPTDEAFGTLGEVMFATDMAEQPVESPLLGTETDDEATADARHCTPPPKMENPSAIVNTEETITREKGRETNEHDRQNAKMSVSVADYWKSRDNGSARKALYRRKDMKPEVDGRINGKIIPELNEQASFQSEENSSQANAVKILVCGHCGSPQKTECRPLTKRNAATIDVHGSSEIESSPLPTKTEEEITLDAQHCITPPEMENSLTGVNIEMVTNGNLREGDKQNAKDFWKSRDTGSASKVLYRRKGVNPKVDDRIDGEIIPESNLQAFVHADDENNEQKHVHAVEVEDRDKTQKMKLPSLAESKAAQVDVQHSSEVESPSLPTETDDEAIFVAQHSIAITQSETENPPTSANINEDVMVTKEKLQEANTRQKMSSSAASFWKSRDKGSASKVLYRRRRRVKQVNAVVEKEDRESPKDMEIPLLADSKPAAIDVQKMESRPLVTDTDDEAASDAHSRTNPPEVENPPASEDMMAKEKTEEASELRKNAKLFGSVANFWKLREQGSESKSLYRRKDMQPVNQTSDWVSEDGPNTST
jgi:hypothetical protein